MRQATMATASSTDQRSNRHTTILLTVAGAMLAGLIYTVVVRDQAISCSNESVGAWITPAQDTRTACWSSARPA
jgi:hypothetical protein